MADLAFCLKNRGHVLREGRRVASLSLLSVRRGRLHDKRSDRQCPQCDLIDPHTCHDALPSLFSANQMAYSETVTFTNPFVQQHWACPPLETPDASLARTRTT